MGKSKKDDPEELSQKLLTNLDEDREKLSKFFDELLNVGDPLITAEFVAKIADALTRQNHLRINALKAKIKKSAEAEEDPFADLGGSPFQDENESQN